MKRMMRWFAVVVCAAGLAGVANAGAGMEVGAKLWYVMFDDSTGIGDTVMGGPKFQWSSPGGAFWASLLGMVGQGTFDTTDDNITLVDGELMLGFSLPWIDVGGGLRYTTWEFTGGDSFNIYGPMVYVGTGTTFGRSPVGWYLGGSIMVLDLGDIEDQGGETGEHFNVEAGLFFAKKHVGATLGFRYKGFLSYNDANETADLTQMGPALSAVVKF
jgi:hypothetical protein